MTRETTVKIVQKIRCEARDAVTALATKALRRTGYAPSVALADRIDAGELRVTEIFEKDALRRDVDRRLYPLFEVFALSAVAFEFSFTMAEHNEASAEAGFRDPFNGGLFTLGAKAGNRLERRNKRDFKVGDTFLELYEYLSHDYCGSITAKHKNYLYPITGEIGLAEVFDTFVELNSRDFDRHSPRALEKFTDTLTFTTEFSASATPKIALTPVAGNRNFRLADAGGSLAARRNDVHQVAIALATGKRVRSIEQARGLVGLRSGAESARERALQTLDQRRTEEFFSSQQEILRRIEGRGF